MTLIGMKDLKKRLGGKKVLKGINLDVKKGEIISLVGPSGSGKSTLLRCLNRLTDPDSGRITFNGKDIRKMEPKHLRKMVVMVFQDSVMFPGTVYDNVSYGLKLNGNEDRALIEESLEEAGLSSKFLDRKAENLSGGEKKRVSLARALTIKPEVLLLDEPTTGVDPKNVEKVERTIVEISRGRKLTVVWVTHDVHQAKRVSHRIANLKGGKVVQVSKASDFKWEGAY